MPATYGERYRLREQLEAVEKAASIESARSLASEHVENPTPMTVTSIRKYAETLTMTITVELDADVERAWQLWADPRQLEGWWGPPTYPATVVHHDLATGCRVTYFMTGADGTRSCGWLQVLDAEPPHRLELKDGFADDSGAPNDAMPTMTMVVTLTDRHCGGTVMAIETRFPSLGAMEQLLSMGTDDLMVAALAQMDEILGGELA